MQTDKKNIYLSCPNVIWFTCPMSNNYSDQTWLCVLWTQQLSMRCCVRHNVMVKQATPHTWSVSTCLQRYIAKQTLQSAIWSYTFPRMCVYYLEPEPCIWSWANFQSMVLIIDIVTYLFVFLYSPCHVNGELTWLPQNVVVSFNCIIMQKPQCPYSLNSWLCREPSFDFFVFVQH